MLLQSGGLGALSLRLRLRLGLKLLQSGGLGALALRFRLPPFLAGHLLLRQAEDAEDDGDEQ